jgi:hypothetical protein
MGLNIIPAPVAVNPVKGIAMPTGTGVPGAGSTMVALGTFDAGVYQVDFTGDVNSVTLGNQTFSASGRTKKITTSTTSSTLQVTRSWVQLANASTAQGGQINSITWGAPGGYVLTSFGSTPRTTVSTSTDLVTWVNRIANTSFSASFYPRAVRFLNGIYVLVGDGGRIQTSTDGITWTTRTSNTTAQLNDVAYGAGVYVTGGASGTIRSSTDAVTWTTRTSNFSTDEIVSVIFANDLFVVGGTAGRLVTSTDGTTWTARTANVATETINQIAFGNSTYVLGAGNGFVRSSTNGITWTTRDVSALVGTNYIQGVGFGNGWFWIVPGGGTSGAASTDGITWTGLSYNNSMALSSAAFANNNYIVVGGNGAGTSRLNYSPGNSIFGGTTQDSGVTWMYCSELSYS